MEKNLTKGDPLKIMIGFSVPYFISYFLQTLYGLADLYIIGKFNGTECTAAVSVGSQIMHMITVMIVGLAMGSTVMIARTVGAEDKKKTAVYTANSIILFAAVSIALTTILL